MEDRESAQPTLVVRDNTSLTELLDVTGDACCGEYLLVVVFVPGDTMPSNCMPSSIQPLMVDATTVVVSMSTPVTGRMSGAGT
jgi:hypothetical protein